MAAGRAASCPGALERLLQEATDPGSPEENWEGIQRFSEEVNRDPQGPLAALRLLEHKIQSPQEAEALHALTVLEVCVNNCGENFHHEMGKFRFLNALIKVLSPKYLGEWSTEKVKARIVELLFSWTVWFPQEVKIRDAYQMLKKQGIVKQDPKLLEDRILPPPSPRPASSIFDADHEKAQLLAKLLKSKNHEDLQAANRLIKGLIQEEQERSAKASRRTNAVKEAHDTAKALEEMLSHYQARSGARSPKPSLEALQDLRARCKKLKPLLFRVASETVENEVALVEILQANDRLVQGLRRYEQLVGTDEGAQPPSPPPDGAGSLPLIDLSDLDLASGAPTVGQEGDATRAPSQGGPLSPASSTHSLDEELLSAAGLPNSPPPGASLPRGGPEVPSLLPTHPASLANLFVPLDSIKLSRLPPVTVFEKEGLKAMLHFSRDPVPGHPDTKVLVLSLLSTAPHPVSNIVFQTAAPKSMAVKLQPATGSELPAFNPLLPPTVISQVLLLANPCKAPLRLRYRLLFTRKGQSHSEVGEVTDFPHEDLWAGS
ncbi:ADP-ribosylation factor-binding protein GGA2 isoform X1 [Pogona vitticeps]